MRSAEEWAQDALFEWLMSDPYPTKPGIEKPSEHEERQRKMMTDIIAGKMRDYAREALEEAEKSVKTISFQPHSEDDYDYRAGCEQTRERIAAALAALHGALAVLDEKGQPL